MREHEPEAYQIGDVPFLGLTISLDSRPLIPRVETEWWVNELIRELGGAKFGAEVTMLDLCAGSGAIGCALLKYVPDAHVHFGEIDPAHEATIRRNIRENGLDEARADVRIGDLFAPFSAMTFDLIAANPPYVPEGRRLEASVEEYEPALALRAGPDGLAVIRRIAAELPAHLAQGGQAWIECDSPAAEAASELFKPAGFSVEVRRDQYDQPRILVIKSPQ